MKKDNKIKFGLLHKLKNIGLKSIMHLNTGNMFLIT